MRSTRMSGITAAACVIFAISSEASHASPVLLWDNGLPNYLNGWNLGNSIADDFLFSSSQTLGSADVYLFNLYRPNTVPSPVNAQGDLFIKVDAANIPILSMSYVILGNINPGGINPNGAPDVPYVYKVSLDLVDTLISGGLHTLEVGSLSLDDHIAWVWTDSMRLQPSNVDGMQPQGYPSPTDLAFQLYGAAIPESPTLALFGAGIIGLGALRRRRHQGIERPV